MKVICITDINPRAGNKTQLIIGEVYTASQCPVHDHCYDLAEVPTFKGFPVSYNKAMFAPLSDIDETTFNRNYQTEKV